MNGLDWVQSYRIRTLSSCVCISTHHVGRRTQTVSFDCSAFDSTISLSSVGCEWRLMALAGQDWGWAKATPCSCVSMDATDSVQTHLGQLFKHCQVCLGRPPVRPPCSAV